MRPLQSLPTHLQSPRSSPFSDAIDAIFHHGQDLVSFGATRVIKRDDSTSTTSSSKSTSTCSSSASGDTCEKPANTSAALPIALGIIIPLLSATVVLIYLHRRNKKRQRTEDRRDAEKYKSMDFGMDLTFSKERKGKKTQGEPNMPRNYRPDMHTRGLSLEAGSPYMFPANADYTASLHSLTRNMEDAHNPYRQADAMSIRAPSPSIRGGRDGDSLRTGNSIPASGSVIADSSQSLLRYPQPPPKSVPPRGSDAPSMEHAAPAMNDIKAFESGFAPVSASNSTLALPHIDTSRDSFLDQGVKDLRKSNNYLGNFIHSRDPSSEIDIKSASAPSKAESITSTLVNSPSATSPHMPDPLKKSVIDMDLPQVVTTSPPEDLHNAVMSAASPTATSPVELAATSRTASRTTSMVSATPRIQSTASIGNSQPLQHNRNLSTRNQSMDVSHRENHNSYMSETSNYDDYQNRDSTYSYHSGAPPRGQSLAAPMQTVVEDYANEYYDYTRASQYLAIDEGLDNRRLSVAMRPLPPDDPNETPEIRANRIRSFYKEYFDKRDTTYQQPGAPPADYQMPPGDYYEDYDQEFMNSATIYDPDRGQFVLGGAPFAQPITRRAMTPPPRAPPRFRGSAMDSRPGSRSHSRGPPSFAHSRPRGHSSTGTFAMPPRSGSAMSAPRGRTQNRKPMPPPAALASLPTPHMLKNDTIFGSAIDFAPPVSYRERQNGRRADSPKGGARPYSPSVRSFNPLASSYDDLNVMPSPHSLRRSGTFTALDFAPPKRFKDGMSDNHSDAGSVRSGRSGMSGVHAYNIRHGAYGVNKLPREIAGTKDEITASLKPRWDMGV